MALNFGSHGVAMLAQRFANLSAALRIPEVSGVTCRGGDDTSAIGTETCGVKIMVVAEKAVERLAALSIPNADTSIPRGRENAVAIPLKLAATTPLS